MRSNWMFAVLLMVAAACGSDDDAASRPPPPENVIGEEAGAFTRVILTAGERSIELAPEQRSRIAPLLTARILRQPEPLSEYGLDHPVAMLTYERATGDVTVVRVGGPTFDERGIYVMRDADPRIFMVLAEQLQPILDLVLAAS